MEITFKEICEAEPGIDALHRIAQMIGSRGGSFCANDVWYYLFKPKLIELVGYERDTHARLSTDERLFSDVAYDTAYQKIYDCLPSCEECGCL